MDPATLALTLGPELLKFIGGLNEKSVASRIANTPRPVMETPPEILDMLSGARSRAEQPNAPGMDNYLGGQTASAVSRLKEVSPSSASLLGGVADVAGKSMEVGAKSNLDYYDKAQENLNNVLNTAGQYSQKNWEWNTGQPYLNAIGAAGKAHEAGRQDINGAATTASNYAQMMALMKMFGKNKGGFVPTSAIGSTSNDYALLGDDGYQDPAGTGDFNPDNSGNA